jgi:Protein phosphatase 2C
MAKRKLPFGEGKRAGTPGKHAARPADPAAQGEPAAEPVHHEPAAGPADWPISVSFTERPPGTPDNVRRWAPIIVDEPIFDFEPKPPSSRFYLPDTIFDGWSSDHFTIRLAAVRGYSHRYHGVPRQDDAQVAFDPEFGAVLFAVADGVSGARESHVGATVACSRTIETMQSQLVNERAIDLPRAVQVTAQRLTEEAAGMLDQDEPTLATVEELLATTLVAGYIRPGPEGASGEIVQIGDSGAWILRGDRYSPAVGRKNDPDAQVISSAVTPLPRIPEHLAPIEFGLLPGTVLLIGTDGFGDPLGDGEGQIGRLFAEHLRAPLPARGLAHLLDFSRDTFDDDRALIAIWPKATGPEVPP